MSLGQFLLPGETVVYEAPGEVFYRRKPFALYVTGGRLLLYAAARSGAERAVAEPLAALGLLEYTEGGLLRRRGRLRARALEHSFALTGEPGTMREVWRALQSHTGRPAADEEATLVAPPPPLFEGESQTPARVEPLATAATRRLGHRGRRAAGVALVICVALAAVALAVVLGRRAAPSPAETAALPTLTPTPAPPTPTPTPAALQVMDEVFELAEGAHRAVPFRVPTGPAAARVSGGFRVTSGGHVDFYVMRPEQYERFAAGGGPEVTSVVYRGEQWNARVGESLPPGDYYLVFDNYDSDDTESVAAEFFVVMENQVASDR